MKCHLTKRRIPDWPIPRGVWTAIDTRIQSRQRRTNGGRESESNTLERGGQRPMKGKVASTENIPRKTDPLVRKGGELPGTDAKELTINGEGSRVEDLLVGGAHHVLSTLNKRRNSLCIPATACKSIPSS